MCIRDRPHAIYLHSSLARDRHGASHSPQRLRRLLKATRLDVLLALVLAGGVNISMLLLAASSLAGVEGTDTIEGAAAAISTHLGPAIGIIFGIGLLASGSVSYTHLDVYKRQTEAQAQRLL